MSNEKTTAAVVFSRDAFRAWLHAPSAADTGEANWETVELLTTPYRSDDGQGGWLAEAALNAVRDADGVWVYGTGVDQVRVWAVADAEGAPDYGLVGEVVVDGAPLSLGHMSETDLIPAGTDMMPGYDAAELVLTALAQRIVTVAAWYRAMNAWPARKSGLAAQLSDEQLDLALTALAALHSTNGPSGLFDDERKAAETVVRVVDADRKRRADADAEVVDAEIVE